MAVHNLILKAGSVCIGLQADNSVSTASSVTQYGITWTFSTSRPVGQFVNGDWWVVGPVTINSVSPAPSGSGSFSTQVVSASWSAVGGYFLTKAGAFADYTWDASDTVLIDQGAHIVRDTHAVLSKVSDDTIEIDGDISDGGGTPSNIAFYLYRNNNTYAKNGSMVNPSDTDEQSFDGHANGYVAGETYPLTLNAGDSLVSAKSIVQTENYTDLIGLSQPVGKSYLQTAAVLTCLDSAPAATAFRPAYFGTTKTIRDSSDIDLDRLPALTYVTGTMLVDANEQTRCAQYTRLMQRVWLNYFNGPYADWIHPYDNMPNYYRETHWLYSEASLLLCCDLPDRDSLAIAFVQHAIDCYAIAESGQRSDRGICKWPVVLAGILLDDAGMKATGYDYYNEEKATYYATSPGPWTDATYRPTAYNTACWRKVPGGEHEHIHPSDWPTTTIDGDYPCRLEGYRRHTHSPCLIGMGLAITLIDGAQAIYDHDPFVDYVDRWMEEDDSGWLEWLSPNICDDSDDQHTGFYFAQGAAFGTFTDGMWGAY